MRDIIPKEKLGEIATNIAATLFAQNAGHVNPHAVVIPRSGPFIFIPGNMETEDDKTNFAECVRVLCTRIKATATIFVTEAWAATVAADDPNMKAGEYVGPQPSERADRQEVLLVQTETEVASGVSVYMAEIKTADDGVRSLSAFKYAPGGMGRFGAGFLPDSRFGKQGNA